MFENKTVLITGGSGSFGQHFTKHLLTKHNPKKVIIFSRDELKQYEMQQRIADYRMRFFLGDVRDSERLKQAFDGVDYVIHAAALKQVPAAEYNPTETIKTNIGGAQNVIEAALECDVEKVMALSTDKEVNPINHYGATKLAATKLFIAANNMAGGKKTSFAVTRYGNVVNSRGSVIPFFMEIREQEEQGIPTVPITHPDMTRFWITLDKGVEFVVKNLRRMQGGETFVPKLPSVRVTDLALAIIPDGKQEMIGIRPGEKIHELMVPKEYAHLTLDCGDYYIVRPTIQFYHKEPTYTRICIAVPVPDNFEYSSGTNPRFLSVEEIRSQLGL